MKLLSFDHLVLVTSNLEKCLAFYEGILGMEAVYHHGRYCLYFGMQTINVYAQGGALPAAKHPEAGSLDICLRAEGNIETARQELLARGVRLEHDTVLRQGALGPMQSLYLRDPDGNLIELGFYQN